MTNELICRLVKLAELYEVSSFLQADPSQFIRYYKDQTDVEPACFIAAMLSFGSRAQFIPKIRSIFELADLSGGISNWLKNGDFKKFFDENSPNFDKKGQILPKFYRFYSFSDMNSLFLELQKILLNYETLGEFFHQKYNSLPENQKIPGCLAAIVSQSFPQSKIVSKGKNSANKRIHMFLRWMVRQNSPVDIGLWNWYSPELLLIPLDVHVMQEAVNLGILPPSAKADFKTAVALTAQMREVFPSDPCRADFSLFGLGVDEKS